MTATNGNSLEDAMMALERAVLTPHSFIERVAQETVETTIELDKKIRPLSASEFLERAQQLADSIEQGAEARVNDALAQKEEAKILAETVRDLGKRISQFDSCVAEARTRFFVK